MSSDTRIIEPKSPGESAAGSRAQWSGKLAFVLAAAASAVGFLGLELFHALDAGADGHEVRVKEVEDRVLDAADVKVGAAYLACLRNNIQATSRTHQRKRRLRAGAGNLTGGRTTRLSQLSLLCLQPQLISRPIDRPIQLR